MTTAQIIVTVLSVGYLFVYGHYWLLGLGGAQTRFIRWLLHLKSQRDLHNLMGSLKDFKLIGEFDVSGSSNVFRQSVEKLYFRLWQEILAVAVGMCFALLAGLVFTWLFLLRDSVGIAFAGGIILALTAYAQWKWIRHLA